MSQFFFQLRRKMFFFGVKNIFRFFFRPKIFFGENPQNRNVQILFDFHRKKLADFFSIDRYDRDLERVVARDMNV